MGAARGCGRGLLVVGPGPRRAGKRQAVRFAKDGLQASGHAARRTDRDPLWRTKGNDAGGRRSTGVQGAVAPRTVCDCGGAVEVAPRSPSVFNRAVRYGHRLRRGHSMHFGEARVRRQQRRDAGRRGVDVLPAGRLHSVGVLALRPAVLDFTSD